MEQASQTAQKQCSLLASLKSVGTSLLTFLRQDFTPIWHSTFLPERLCFPALISFPCSGPFSKTGRPNGTLHFNPHCNWAGITPPFKEDLKTTTLSNHKLWRLFILLLFPPSKGKTLISFWWGQSKQTKTTTKWKKTKHSSHSYSNGQQDKAPRDGNSHAQQSFRMTANKYCSTRIFSSRNLRG